MFSDVEVCSTLGMKQITELFLFYKFVVLFIFSLIHLFLWILATYDGASVMSSGKEGVQAKIKEISPLALFTHCYAHCLNLSIAETCKPSEMQNLIVLINEVYLFLNNNPKRQQLFELTLKEYLPENSHSRLPGLCKTRWVERHTCLDVFKEMYELLVTGLSRCCYFPPRVPKFEIVY